MPPIDFKALLDKERSKVSQPQNAVPNSPASPSPSMEKKDSTAVSSTAPQVASQTTVIAPVAPVPATTQDTVASGLGMPNESAPAGAVIDYPGLYELREKILNLDKALLTNHPAMDSLLQTIHRNLQKDAELLHLLKPEERATIFQGLQKKTQTKIVTDTVKSASSGKNKSLKNIGLEDLM